jgi:hypothetical protein
MFKSNLRFLKTVAVKSCNLLKGANDLLSTPSTLIEQLGVGEIVTIDPYIMLFGTSKFRGNWRMERYNTLCFKCQLNA